MWTITYTVMMRMEYFLEQNELFSNILAFSVFSWIPQRWSERFLEPIFEFPSGPGVLTAGLFPYSLPSWSFGLSEPRLFSYSW